jgi:acetyltransferase
MFLTPDYFATIVTDEGYITKIDAITLKSVTLEDNELQRSFFNSLSSQSRFLRFMSPMGEIPDYVLRILSKVNPENHIAYMLTTGSGHERKMIGEARLVIRGDDISVADFAIAIMDDQQGNGLAKKLMALLESAAAQHGIQTLIGQTMRTNKAMKTLARRHNYNIRNDAGDARAVIMEKFIELQALCA